MSQTRRRLRQRLLQAERKLKRLTADRNLLSKTVSIKVVTPQGNSVEFYRCLIERIQLDSRGVTQLDARAY